MISFPKLSASVLLLTFLGHQNYGLACVQQTFQRPNRQSVSTKLLGDGENRYGCALTGTSFESFPVECQTDHVEVSHDHALPLEVVPLVISGNSNNRVDLVFFSDGYVESERGKFIEDAQRLADDITRNQTFYTVQPLMNFWAAFSPSRESGIGVGGVAKDTVYGLYRDGTELRGVYYKKPEVARDACRSLGDGCDYPILLGNDPYYGGLGGEFTTVTSSYFNGPLVLRHELGHSIIDVGEEYDGGFAYFGVNAITNLSGPVSWEHWLTEREVGDGGVEGEGKARGKSEDHGKGGYRIERSVMPLQKYVWTMLNATTPWSIIFPSSGLYSRHLVKFSLSGIPQASFLKVELDGADLGWAPEPSIGRDRWHYDMHRAEGLKAGEHELKFTLREASVQGVAQLCSVEVVEFGDEEEFISTHGHYGLYPTYSIDNVTSYRPTNGDCLMRAVTTPNFCKVCIEGLWLSLLGDLNLIESLTESCEPASTGTGATKKAQRKVLELTLLPLAQYRAAAHMVAHSESYVVTWRRDGEVVHEFANRTRVEIDNDDPRALGTYVANVEFMTDEVRVRSQILTDSAYREVVSKCT